MIYLVITRHPKPKTLLEVSQVQRSIEIIERETRNLETLREELTVPLGGDALVVEKDIVSVIRPRIVNEWNNEELQKSETKETE